MSSGATGYSAAYDATGELTCRAAGASTCTNATPTGQALGYDALRRLISWQDATTAPTATGTYAYDGIGSRVWLQDTSNSGGVTTTTTTTYILGIAEITSTQTGQGAASTTATRFYPLPGGVSALRVAAGLSYVASDHLGTPIATLNLDTGAVLGEHLRAPYGQARYAASASVNGGMRTTHGFTGQREDAATGLDYYGFRYYDPVAGQFISADTALTQNGYTPWGLSRYGYVQGNPETKTDPDGHCWPLCTMIIGAVVGAVVGAGISVATQAVSGKPIDWGQVGKEAAVGAVSGAIYRAGGARGGHRRPHGAGGGRRGGAGQVGGQRLGP